MRDAKDTATAEIPGVKPPPAKRGRKPIYATSAEKQAAYRSRHGTKPVTVQLPVGLLAEFNAELQAKGKTQSAVIAKLIRTQFLRKR